MSDLEMFGEKCPRCDKRVSKKHDFCAYCGVNLNAEDSSSGNEGFLGNNDNLNFKLPFGFNALMKPLMKELSKQMLELDKELKKEQQDDNKGKKGKSVGHFNIHIGIPGQSPIKINTNNFSPKIASEKNEFNLPKISGADFDKAKNFPREEPNTNMRRLSDRLIYEIELPEVISLDKVNISILEEGIEVKAIAKNVVYNKLLDVTLPLNKCEFKKDLLVLELGLK